MRHVLAILLVCLNGCDGGGNTLDSGTSLDGGSTDGAATSDGKVPDGQVSTIDAASVDAGPECNGSGGSIHKAVGGSAGKTTMLDINIGGQATDSDGILGPVTENGNDVQLEDVAVFSPAVAYGVGGGLFYQVAYLALGSFTATRLGAAPGIDALAAFSNTHVFGAAGLALSRITPSPFAVTPIATVAAPGGCTKIVDFIAAISGGAGSFVFIVALDCGTSTKITGYTWTEGTTTLGAAGPDINAPAGAVGLSLGMMVTADNKLYRYSTVGSGTITFVRNLSACLNTTIRGMQE